LVAVHGLFCEILNPPLSSVRSIADLPPARVVLFDTGPSQLADIGESILPAGYVRAPDGSVT
jgi:hypothetical protein